MLSILLVTPQSNLASVVTMFCINLHLPVDPSILNNWTSQFPFLWVSGVHSYFILFRIDIPVTNVAISENPDQTPCSMASDPGLHCLPMSQKCDARVI